MVIQNGWTRPQNEDARMAFRHAQTQFLKTTLIAATATLICTPLASAGSRHQPAPIVYAGKGAAAPDATVAPASRAPAAAPRATVVSSATGGERIQFRYPSSPEPATVSTPPAAPTFSPPVQMAALTAPTVSTAAPVRAPVAAPAPAPAPIPFDSFDEGRAVAPAEAAPVALPTPARADTVNADEFGIASWYGESFHGAPTANGEIFDMNAMTAAHPTLPLPSLVQIVNTENGREVVVRVNDRGPFVDGRAIDLSKAAADQLGFADSSEANVRIRYLGSASPVPTPEQHEAPKVLAAVEKPFAAEPRLPVPDPVVPGASSASTGTFFVQLGAFSDISNAQTLQSSLGGRYPVKIETARVRGADFFRVFVGPVSSRAAADARRDGLVRDGFQQGVIVSR